MAELKYDKKTGRLLFTKQMKREYTILMPNMAPIHFRILKNVFVHYGYKAELLETTGPEIAQTGLKYVHNDTCYPALLVIGQFIHALQSGNYDVHKIALMITQTGGGCRASNYIFLLRKALKKAGFAFVPVISLSFGMEKNPGFSLTLPLIRRFVGGLVYGDQLMLLSNQIKPYEVNRGETMALVKTWSDRLSAMLIEGKGYTLEEIDKQNACQRAGILGDRLTAGLQNIIDKYNLPFVAFNQGSICHMETVGTMHLHIDWSKPWQIPAVLKESDVRKAEMQHMGAAYMAEGIVTVGGSRLYTSAAYNEEMIDDALSRFDRIFSKCIQIGE